MGPWSMVLGWIAGAFVQTERIAGEDRAQLVRIPGMLALAIAVPAVVLGGIAVTLLLNRPHLTLDRDGITAQGLVRRTVLRWDRLLPGGPPPPPRRAASIPLLRSAAVAGTPSSAYSAVRGAPRAPHGHRHATRTGSAARHPDVKPPSAGRVLAGEPVHRPHGHE
jgi:hypothetical protein